MALDVTSPLTCVVLPQPVSPLITATWFSRTICRISSCFCHEGSFLRNSYSSRYSGCRMGMSIMGCGTGLLSSKLVGILRWSRVHRYSSCCPVRGLQLSCVCEYRRIYSLVYTGSLTRIPIWIKLTWVSTGLCVCVCMRVCVHVLPNTAQLTSICLYFTLLSFFSISSLLSCWSIGPQSTSAALAVAPPVSVKGPSPPTYDNKANIKYCGSLVPRPHGKKETFLPSHAAWVRG